MMKPIYGQVLQSHIIAILESSRHFGRIRRLRLGRGFPPTGQRVIAPWRWRSIKKLPRCRAVEMTDACSDKSGRLEVHCVHRNRRVAAFLPVLIVGDAAAFLAAIIVANLPVPGIFRKAAFGGFDFDRGRGVVCPERAVAAADLTIAAR
jgi:hypothetical protein